MADNSKKIKIDFEQKLNVLTQNLKNTVSTNTNEWTIKGFIDSYKNIFPISQDTKIISKLLEIHLFSNFLDFAKENDFELVLAEKQNWYPDISFVSKSDEKIKFALDIKTTYRLSENPKICNGFTLGSHGEYFTNQNSTKNIQFPYKDYLGHYVLGIIYDRNILEKTEETNTYTIENLQNIPSVISNFEFFVQEKWKIASDKSGSGNTANIGSITNIDDILSGKGVFSKIGETFFNEYWQNYGKIIIENKKITNIKDYLKFKGKTEEWISKNIS